jgi:PmbA protein
MHFQELCRDIVKKVPFEAEAFIINSKTLSIEINNQKIEAINKGTDFGIALRVIKDKKMGFAYSSDIDIDSLIDKALHNSNVSEIDEFNQFAQPTKNSLAESVIATPNEVRGKQSHCNNGIASSFISFSPRNDCVHSQVSEPLTSLDLFDKEIDNASMEDKIRIAKEVEKAAYDTDKRITKSEHVSYSEHETEIYISNSNGINNSYKTNNCGGFAQIICESNGEAEEGMAADYFKKWSDLNPKQIGKEAAINALELIGGKTIKTEKMPIIFNPFVGAEFMDAISGILSAEAVQKNKSALAGKIETSVASKIVTVLDDGTMEKGLGSAPFDAEGTPCRKNLLIDNGILKCFMHNTYTASKDKTASTGNAERISFKSTPGIGLTNFYIKPGIQKKEDLISKVRKGLYITRVMAMHSVNPISGDFSVGAAGIMIENGQKTYPVRAVTIAGNLLELLHSIEDIADDLRFFVYAGNCGSPTLLISSLMVGGE